MRMRHIGRVMGEDGEAVTLDGVRAYLRSQFNGAVRRPGMYGGVIALHLYVDESTRTVHVLDIDHRSGIYRPHQ